MKEVETFAMDEKNKKINNGKNNISKPLLFLVTIGILSGLVYVLYAYTDYIKPIIDVLTKDIEPIKEEKKVVIFNEVKYELGSKLKENVNIYVSNASELGLLKLDLSNISVDEENNVDELGEFEIKLTYNEEEFIGRVLVEDTTPPEVMVKTAYIPIMSPPIKPDIFFRNVSDNSKNYVSEIINISEIHTNVLGETKVKIVVKDLSDNETTVESKLVVLGSNFAEVFDFQDLNVSYNDKNDLNWDGTITEKFPTAVTKTSSFYSTANQKINDFGWQNKISTMYPDAEIKKEETMLLYNQKNLIVGLTKTVTLEISGKEETHYLSY